MNFDYDADSDSETEIFFGPVTKREVFYCFRREIEEMRRKKSETGLTDTENTSEMKPLTETEDLTQSLENNSNQENVSQLRNSKNSGSPEPPPEIVDLTDQSLNNTDDNSVLIIDLSDDSLLENKTAEDADEQEFQEAMAYLNTKTIKNENLSINDNHENSANLEKNETPEHSSDSVETSVPQVQTNEILEDSLKNEKEKSKNKECDSLEIKCESRIEMKDLEDSFENEVVSDRELQNLVQYSDSLEIELTENSVSPIVSKTVTSDSEIPSEISYNIIEEESSLNLKNVSVSSKNIETELVSTESEADCVDRLKYTVSPDKFKTQENDIKISEYSDHLKQNGISECFVSPEQSKVQTEENYTRISKDSVSLIKNETELSEKTISNVSEKTISDDDKPNEIVLEVNFDSVQNTSFNPETLSNTSTNSIELSSKNLPELFNLDSESRRNSIENSLNNSIFDQNNLNQVESNSFLTKSSCSFEQALNCSLLQTSPTTEPQKCCSENKIENPDKPKSPESSDVTKLWNNVVSNVDETLITNQVLLTSLANFELDEIEEMSEHDSTLKNDSTLNNGSKLSTIEESPPPQNELETTFDRIERLLEMEAQLNKTPQEDSPLTRSIRKFTDSLSMEKTPESVSKLKTQLFDQLAKIRTTPTKPNFKTPISKPKSCRIPTLKNIVSPVAYYVNQSPSTPLIRKVTPITKKVTGITNSDHKPRVVAEGNPLPKCVYKTGRVKLFEDTTSTNVPKPVQRYFSGIPKQCVIKHEGRFKGGNQRVVPAMINDTVNSIMDQTIPGFNESTDSNVSVQLQKPAIRKVFK